MSDEDETTTRPRPRPARSRSAEPAEPAANAGAAQATAEPEPEPEATPEAPAERQGEPPYKAERLLLEATVLLGCSRATVALAFADNDVKPEDDVTLTQARAMIDEAAKRPVEDLNLPELPEQDDTDDGDE